MSADGRFSLTVAPGTYLLKVSGSSLSAWVDGFRLDGDTTRDLVLPVIPVDVDVHNNAGQPLAGVRVGIGSSDSTAPFQLVPGGQTAAANSNSDLITDAGGHVHTLALSTSSDLYVSAWPSTTQLGFTGRSTGPLTGDARRGLRKGQLTAPSVEGVLLHGRAGSATRLSRLRQSSPFGVPPRPRWPSPHRAISHVECDVGGQLAGTARTSATLRA